MSDDDLDKIHKKIFTWIILAMFGSIGVNQGIQSNFTVRADKFTGTQGQEHESRLDVLERHMSLSKYRMGICEGYHKTCMLEVEKMKDHIRLNR